MNKQTRGLAAAVAAGALLAVPVTGQAAKPSKPGKRGSSAASCTKPHNVGFRVTGTLVSVTADDPTTPASEATVTLTVRSANRHARHSGEIADQNAARRGVQVRGASFTVPAGDAFVLRLRGYEGTDTPSVGDRVKVHGRIALTKRRCAPAGTSIADRLGAVDVRRVTISDRDPDA
jgi:hypothetical protein